MTLAGGTSGCGTDKAARTFYGPRIDWPADKPPVVPPVPSGDKRVSKVTQGSQAPYTGLLFTPAAAATAEYDLNIAEARLGAEQMARSNDRETAQRILDRTFQDMAEQLVNAEREADRQRQWRNALAGVAVVEAVILAAVYVVATR